MKKRRLSLPERFDNTWTLFLDRDGVINKRIVNQYVLEWRQFEFLSGVLEALRNFSSVFGRIVVVTNQQGIGKGLMNESDLRTIHKNMIAEIERNGGRIDAVYFSPFLKESNHYTRKPNVGMGLKARKEFKEIDYRRSVMAGDSESDMDFGHRLGMINVLINEDNEIARKNKDLVSLHFQSLKAFSESLKTADNK